ncbi:MAG: D-tyrosyl-tRNA(Tyr) deacylase [Helicobacteraceae bacterium 4484_230]|nr:MAG: D-tyrosyl-tRNA(Tyr) deacylase [Helicobacteraceae bacterium 4484_230]
MIAVLQRVSASSVYVDNVKIASIGKGLNILLGIMEGDDKEEIDKALAKIVNLRIFADEVGKMNLSLLDIRGEMLVISQFTLGASIKKGRRPSFDAAAKPDDAQRLYLYFIEQALKKVPVLHGKFGEHMDVYIENDGPVTILVDSKEL